MNFHFTGFITTAPAVTHTVTITGLNVLDAALAAGSQIRSHFGTMAHITVERVAEAPAPIVTDEHAATREMGRKMGLTETQIDAFIARQV